jgi:hypothetical protein
MLCYYNESISPFVCNMYWFQLMTHQSANHTHTRPCRCGPAGMECDFLTYVVVKMLTLKIVCSLIIPGGEVLSTEMPSTNR